MPFAQACFTCSFLPTRNRPARTSRRHKQLPDALASRPSWGPDASARAHGAQRTATGSRSGPGSGTADAALASASMVDSAEVSRMK